MPVKEAAAALNSFVGIGFLTKEELNENVKKLFAKSRPASATSPPPVRATTVQTTPADVQTTTAQTTNVQPTNAQTTTFQTTTTTTQTTTPQIQPPSQSAGMNKRQWKEKERQ